MLALDPARRFLMVNRAAQRVVGGRAPADQRFTFEELPLTGVLRGERLHGVELTMPAPGGAGTSASAAAPCGTTRAP